MGIIPPRSQPRIATARTGSWKRVLVMFQPHRYTRTLALQEEFGSAFDRADAVFVSDVYPASEKPIPGVSGQMIVDAMRAHGHPAWSFNPASDVFMRAPERKSKMVISC